MSEEKKNVPVDPLAPEIPEQAKVPETPTTRVEQKLKKEAKKIREFKKDIKFLWIYCTVFCIALVAIVGASYFIQEKIHDDMDDYKEQAQTATESDKQNKSLLSNIQEKYAQAQKENEYLKNENATLKAGAENDEALINKGEAIIQQQGLLLKVGKLCDENKLSEAREVFKTIDASQLPQSEKETYTYYEERLK
ncbi:MAG: hypothetical protein IJN42_02760 [Clostridia bacterium]|nr:hypothetical protein [Clostridia bacterium]